MSYEKPWYKALLVVVEVPDDFPQERVEEMVSEEQVMALAEGCEVYETGEPALVCAVDEITKDDGYPHYRLVDGALVRIEG